MIYKRESDKKVIMRVWNELKRVWFVLFVMVVMFIASLFLPTSKEEAEYAGSLLNIMALFVTKTNSVLWGWLLAHIIRMFMFPYGDLQRYIEDKNWAGALFITAIYGVVIHAFAVGG